MTRRDPWASDLVIEHCGDFRCVGHCKNHDCERCEFFCNERRIEAREALRDFRG